MGVAGRIGVLGRMGKDGRLSGKERKRERTMGLLMSKTMWAGIRKPSQMGVNGLVEILQR
jgi:hypothetical protein